MSNHLPPPQPPRSSNSKTTTIVTVVVVSGLAAFCLIAIVLAIFIPAATARRQTTQRIQDTNRAKQIALALLNYEVRFRRMPSAYSVDEDGNPLLSWRVHVLPYMGYQDLYNQFDLHEPWDSPHNKPLSKTVMPIFQSAAESDATSAHTNYVAVLGERNVFRHAGEVRVKHVTDGMSKTLLFVQTQGKSMPWAAPMDLEMSTIAPGINNPAGPSIGSKYPGALAAFGDGSVQFLSDDIDPEVLASMLIVDDQK